MRARARANSEMQSYLIEISAKIFATPDVEEGGWLVDKILDKTGMKGTGMWTVQQAAEQCVAIPTISAALDARYLSGLKEERVRCAKVYTWAAPQSAAATPVPELVDLVRQALYASKICSYAQGLNIIRAASHTFNWNLNLGQICRIWKGGCIIRAVFLDRIKRAYDRDAALPNLLFDHDFSVELQERQAAWRRIVSLAIAAGIAVPAFSSSLAYFDTYRRERLPANLLQAQRDLFGAHTYERIDKPGTFHTQWTAE